MLGFSLPKILLLFIILFFIWNLFRYLEKKSDDKTIKEKKSQFDDKALTECSVCGGFYDKSVTSRCPMCANTFEK